METLHDEIRRRIQRNNPIHSLTRFKQQFQPVITRYVTAAKDVLKSTL